MAIVYRHRRLDNNQIFYVGIGKEEKRAYSKSGRSGWWRNITKNIKYKVEVLIRDLSWEDSCELEVLLIKEYGRQDIDTGILINLTDGGEGTSGAKPSETTRKIQSDKAKKRASEDKGHLEKARKVKLETGIRIKELTTGIEFNLVDSQKYFDIPKTTISKNSLIGNPLRSAKFNGLNFTRLKGQKKDDMCVLNILPITKRTAPTNNRLVLDTSTGIFWNSIYEASVVYNIQITKLKRKLSGKYINDTNLILV